MNAFAAIVFASLVSRLGYQMGRSPLLPAFAAHLSALPKFIGVIVAASTITGVFFKLPSGALSDVLGRKRMMVLGALSLRYRRSSIRSSRALGRCSPSVLFTALRQRFSRRSVPLMSRASLKPGAARVSAGSRRATISVQPRVR